MRPGELAALIALVASAVLVASVLSFLLLPESVAVPTFPSQTPAAVPVPVRLPFATSTSTP